VTITFVDDRLALARRKERDPLTDHASRPVDDRSWLARAFDLFAGARDRRSTARCPFPRTERVACYGVARLSVDAIDRLIDRYGPAAVTTAVLPLISEARVARIDAVLAARLASVTTIVEDTYDPHNAAATIRTTEALGLQDLHVVASERAFAANSGVTVGSHQWIDLHRWARADEVVAALHERGFRVVATVPGATTSIDAIDATTPIAVMFGNEHDGLSEAAVRACDATAAIAMYGFAESYNLSVTVALVMSAVAARRRTQLGAAGDLDDERRTRLRARWLALGVRAAEAVIERACG
jgi:tRNA (guanosine-2'-O-)-methyltransferase